MIGPLLSGAVGLASEWLKGRAKKHQTEAEADAKIKTAAATSVAEWERLQAAASGDSWKDEFWTVLFGVIILACFVPWTQPYVMTGFEALETTPAWFQWAVGASIAASFGIRGFQTFRNGRK